MSDSPSGRCGYAYQREFPGGDAPRSRSCCYRKTLSDTNRCAWHANPNETNEKTVAALQAARAPPDVQKQNRPFAELLDGVILSRTELGDEISFERTALREADFTDAILTFANFTGANLSEADLSGANLNTTTFTGAVLVKTDFSNADLQGVIFSNAYLIGATLTNAHLPGGIFSEAHLTGADFTNANLAGANFTDANLKFATLTDAHLGFATFTDAHIKDADFTGANLAKSNLSRANLEDASLSDVNLDQANLSNAALHNCRLQGVYISEETGIGDCCVYERAADPYDILPWKVVNPSMELVTLTDDDHHLYEGGQLTAGWYRFWYWSGHLWGQSSDADEIENLDKAGSIYRTYQRLHRENSLPWNIPKYYYREKEIRRLKALAEGNTRVWLYQAVQRWVMGYGERPWRVVGTSLGVIMGFGLLYPFVGGMEATDSETATFSFVEPISLSSGPEWARTIFENLYFSTVTFTTLGYGDIQPGSDIAKVLASIESFLGALLMALLVAVLTRRTMR